MSSYKHFTLEERKYLQKLLSEGVSLRKIAAILERSPSTISREVHRNRSKYKPHHKPDNPYWYNHWRAQNLYIERRRNIRTRAIKAGTQVWEFVLFGLTHFWSPEQICADGIKNIQTKNRCISQRFTVISEMASFQEFKGKRISDGVESIK